MSRWTCRRCGNDKSFDLVPHISPAQIKKWEENPGPPIIDDRKELEYSPTVYCGKCGAMVEPGGKKRAGPGRAGLSPM